MTLRISLTMRSAGEKSVSKIPSYLGSYDDVLLLVCVCVCGPIGCFFQSIMG